MPTGDIEILQIDSKSTILVYRDKGIQNELPPIFEQKHITRIWEAERNICKQIYFVKVKDRY